MLIDSNDTDGLRLLADLLRYYSEPDQKDDSRMNCALSLSYMNKRWDNIINIDVKLYLSFMSTIIKLLVDEIATVI